MSYFSVKGLQKTWGKKIITFNMESEENKLTCLLGPSGSGKSTILNIIAGFEKNDDTIDDFEIILDGKRIEKLSPSKRDIGMVFQNGALFNQMSVVDNVAYGLISKGFSKKVARQKASEYLSFFDLYDFDKRLPQTLSGGEKQRVALARTLIMNPKLVLFDEPLSALDTDLRKKMAVQLKEWQKKIGFTAIMVTHDEEEANFLADKTIRINENMIY